MERVYFPNGYKEKRILCENPLAIFADKSNKNNSFK